MAASWIAQFLRGRRGGDDHAIDGGRAVGAVGTALAPLRAPGLLDARTREFMALAIAVSHGCASSITLHTIAVRAAGASEAELAEAMGAAMELSASPAYAKSSQLARDSDRNRPLWL
ncbi:carboxymuconolactone decarboxylase family protein [Pseudorhodoferax soli]|nr:carboxymuconolactone decarboxylase family protein [Pseudorhodoferax soli]